MKTKTKKQNLSLWRFSVKWDSDRVHFSKELAGWLHEGGYKFAGFDHTEGKLYFSTWDDEHVVPIYFSKYTDGKIRAQVTTSGFAKDLLYHFGVEKQSWYFRFERFYKKEQLENPIAISLQENMAKERESIFRKCAKCGRELLVSDFYAKGKGLQAYCKDCMKQYGRLRNGTTGEYKKDLSSFTDKELYDELVNRGYKGEMVKIQKLES